jgi:hypothetical protein
MQNNYNTIYENYQDYKKNKKFLSKGAKKRWEDEYRQSMPKTQKTIGDLVEEVKDTLASSTSKFGEVMLR